MIQLLWYVVFYIVGGVTLAPLVLVSLWISSPKAQITEEDKARDETKKSENESQRKGNPKGYSTLKSTEVYYDEDLDVKAEFEGWLTVTHEFYTLPEIQADQYRSNASFNGNPTENTSDSSSNGTGFIRMVKEIGNNSSKDPQPDVGGSDAHQLKQVRKRSRFFAVLKHKNLFLYRDETRKDVQHVIVLNSYFVTMWPRNLVDARLFTKYTAICLLKKQVSQPTNNKPKPLSTKELLYLLHKGSQNTALPAGSYFLYGDTNHDKEDWYFAILRATSVADSVSNGTDDDLLNSTLNAKPLFFNTSHMIDLLQTINSTEGQLSTKWINALIGRLFLSVYKTDAFKQGFKKKFDEKLRRIRTPGFLDELQIGHINVGKSAPFITHPRMKHLTPEGDLELEMVIDYSGGLTVEIATKVFLNLGAHFRQREFDVNLKVILRKLHGDLLVKMKPLPSTRIWYTFKSMPEIDLEIEPVVSSRTVNYNLVTNILDKRFKDAIRTTLVYPFMDDILFFDTSKEIFRGGIWDHSQTASKSKAISKNVELDQASENAPTSSSNTTEAFVEIAADFGNHESTGPTSTSVSGTDDSNTVTTPFAEAPPPELVIENEDGDADSVSNASMHSHSPSVTSSFQKYTTGGKNIIRKYSSFGSNSDSHTDTEKSELSQAAVQIKNGVNTSVSKFRQWYSKKTSSETHSRSGSSENNYNPPEMITSRRKRDSSLSSSIISMEGSESITGNQAQINISESPPSPEMFISENLRRQRHDPDEYMEVLGSQSVVSPVLDDKTIDAKSTDTLQSFSVHNVQDTIPAQAGMSVWENSLKTAEKLHHAPDIGDSATTETITAPENTEYVAVEPFASADTTTMTPLKKVIPPPLPQRQVPTLEKINTPPKLPSRSLTTHRKPPPATMPSTLPASSTGEPQEALNSSNAGSSPNSLLDVATLPKAPDPSTVL
ncbi:hypothetical protein FOA43_000287 [Brettanomyces nanus]|uniref:SMP-LTD domain-containing protein n=1 Tax=Eeniella nana TaxID=13502 RepID=A0A875RWV4_EENNA|nr:uncharacterized protein FOA43_000287 [Brettanomyces nanus]QPG72983.1 hypothetical protein FOA43_000287 [Brettanomyces nanus]